MVNTYYKLLPKHRPYKGERYFRVIGDIYVVQVCVFAGEVKKGKNNAVGIILIHRLTLFANYLSPGYAVPCTKKEYNKKFNKVVNALK